MEIKRNGTRPSGKGPADWFTGTVRIDPLFSRPDPGRVAGASVTFEPGARTAWHTHPLGQTLIVTVGLRPGAARGRAGRGDPARRCRLVPAGREALARRSPTTAMTHIAVQEALDGKVVDWMEQVTRRAIPRLSAEGEANAEAQTRQAAAWRSRPLASAAWG